jgi:uncharacterized coiled-coil protein SlyX
MCKKNKSKKILIAISVTISVAFVGVYRVYAHEKWQSDTIHSLAIKNASDGKTIQDLTKQNAEQEEKIIDLQNSLSSINGKFQSELDETGFVKKCSKDGYDAVFLGNSITKHPLTSYWWNEIGMAATVAENDYVHQTVSSLIEKYTSVNYAVCNYAAWETQSNDRAETFPSIDTYLNSEDDLVIVQLGENVSDATTYESDYEELLRHIKILAPNAKIISIGNFWENNDIDNIKIEVSQKLDVLYADLSEIQNNQNYQVGLGSTVYDSDGNPHIIEHEGVARHPNDLGMKYISDDIMSLVNE